MTMNELIASYLSQPYSRLIVPETDGTYRGEILEFPGCIATGETPAETLATLEEVASDWLEAALANGQNVPKPIENNEFSGRLVLRIPKGLHKKAARLAERDGVSLNQFIMAGLAEHVGERARTQNSITINAIYGVTTGHFLRMGALRAGTFSTMFETGRSSRVTETHITTLPIDVFPPVPMISNGR